MNTERVRELNDAFRTSFVGGAVMLTSGVAGLDTTIRRRLISKIRYFDAFDDGNDPHGEHDFGQVELEGDRFFWKLDYYDRTCERASPNPADPAVTTRVLTVMLASEY